MGEVVRNSLRPVRSLMAMLRDPSLRGDFSTLVAAEGGSCDIPANSPLVRIGVAVADSEGCSLDERFLDRAIASLDGAMGPAAILDAPKIRTADLSQDDLDAVVRDVAHRVVCDGDVIDEPTANARLGMLVEDVAFFRRHAVDTGVLTRSRDGARYARAVDAASGERVLLE